MIKLNELTQIPPKLLTAKVEELSDLLGGPTLLTLKGKDPRVLFVSCLLHGNEHTGFLAVQKLLQRYQARELPRSLTLLIGNVEAGRCNLRKLETQPDFNRVWRDNRSPEGQLMQTVIARVQASSLFATVDIHNNTGNNPFYSCVVNKSTEHLQLASLFGRTAVLVRKPVETLANVFAEMGPTVVLECGVSGEPKGVDRVLEYLQSCLNLADIRNHEVAVHDCQLYESIARVKVPHGVSFCFEGQADESDADIVFIAQMDRLNFSELAPGTQIGRIRAPEIRLLLESLEPGVTQELLSYEDQEITLTRELVPCMLTLNRQAILDDCVGYLMKPHPLPNYQGR